MAESIGFDEVVGEEIALVVSELGSNLIEHAGGGTLTLGAVTDQGRRGVQIESLDHGPGIAAAERQRLFRPFSKSAKDAANSAPGVGLGLALCRRLAADLGGRLQVECTPGNGAQFTLSLPLGS